MVRRSVTRESYDEGEAELTSVQEYHTGSTKRVWKGSLDSKPFVVWDGEGITFQEGEPQAYVLFGCYNGVTHERIVSRRLRTLECLAFIHAMGRANPGAWHVSFAFDYDVNMILRDLPRELLQRLRRTGHCFFHMYRLEHIPGKWLRVTTGVRHRNKRLRVSVTIEDIFSFFQTSFEKALASYLPPLPEWDAAVVHCGKAMRGRFLWNDMGFVEEYWGVENKAMHALVCRLREMMYAAGMRITRWHGPGVLANYTYRTNGVAVHKADCGKDVYDASRFAYAGGRFELFRLGRHENVYGLDINSAYPAAISRLPSLSEGTWDYVAKPRRVVEFGLYHIRLRGAPFTRVPSPLFHRDSGGNISFPWVTEGWYWSPEIKALITAGVTVEIIEAWEYTGWRTRPFAFVPEMYERRRELKRVGDGAQVALKLALNSLYGKMAQRAGWERRGIAPTWHQLEWAGWVTSYTRAMLYGVLSRVPWDSLVAVETDGLFTTCRPQDLGIAHGMGLGEWEVTEYDEIVYLQSGVYAKRVGDSWSSKYRGLDAASVSTSDIVSHARNLLANSEWPPLKGTTTRFVGYRQALFREEQSRGDYRKHHCVWETEPKAISCGGVGKRVHVSQYCAACKAGASAYEMPHDLTICSRSVREPQSTRHDIPWIPDGELPEWREMEILNDGMVWQWQ